MERVDKCFFYFKLAKTDVNNFLMVWYKSVCEKWFFYFLFFTVDKWWFYSFGIHSLSTIFTQHLAEKQNYILDIVDV